MSLPWVQAALLTAVAVPGGELNPWGGSLDGSWILAMSFAHSEGVRFGSELVFSYGPLGFLAVPLEVDTLLMFLGLLFRVLVCFATYLAAIRWMRKWMSPIWAFAGGLAVAVVMQGFPPIHMAGAALVLWVLWSLEQERCGTRTPLWALGVLGAVLSLLLLIQFSLGFLGIAVVALALASPPRWPRVAAVVGGSSIALVVLWMMAGQTLFDLPVWLRWSVDVASGYSEAMVLGQVTGQMWWLAAIGTATATAIALTLALRWESLNIARHLPWVAIGAVGLLGTMMATAARLIGSDSRLADAPGIGALLAFAAFHVFAAAMILVGLARMSKEHRDPRTAAFAIAIICACWLYLKESFVRFDMGHAFIFLPLSVLLILTFPWRGRLRAFGATALVLAVAVATLWAGGVGSLAESRRAATVGFLEGVRQVIDPNFASFRKRHHQDALVMWHPVDQSVIDSVRGRSVHADPWDVSVIYAYDLDWHPVPMFQSLTAYTAGLDDLNAAALTGDNAPEAVLLNTGASPIDDRNPHWESPDYQVALACNYKVAQESGGWQALLKSPDMCGEPVPMGDVIVREGEEVSVPSASHPDSIVVARFRLLDRGLVDALVGTLLRPFSRPWIFAGGQRFSLVEGTAAGQHIVAQPVEVGVRRLPFGSVDYGSLRFEGVGRGVIVEFFEITTDASEAI